MRRRIKTLSGALASEARERAEHHHVTTLNDRKESVGTLFAAQFGGH